MLLTPQHRRSSRLSRKATKPKIAKKETYDLSLQCDEEMASDWDTQEKKRLLIEEDIYADCPEFEGFEYNKDYYLSSSNYSNFIDDEIAKLTLAAKAKSAD